MAKGLSAVDFVRVYGPMAKQGKSALEIGQALGFTGDAKKVAIAVSVKASQLRKRLIHAATVDAKNRGLSVEDTENLVKTMADKLPKISGGRGRKSNVAAVVSELDKVLAEMDAAATVAEEPAVTEEPAEKPKRRRSILG